MSSAIDRITDLLGRPIAVAIAVISVLAWATAGPFAHFSDRWWLTVQTGTSIVTFLMIFCVQHTQSKDDIAMQAKLDELIRSISAARNELIGIERTDRQVIAEIRSSD